MFTSRGRNTASAALRELRVMSRTLGTVTPLGVTVMRTKDWWTAAAIGRSDTGWVAASAFYDQTRGVRTYPVLWHHGNLLDPTGVYVAFRAQSEQVRIVHARAGGVSERQAATLTGISHRGLLHLLTCAHGFDLEVADFLSAMSPQSGVAQSWVAPGTVCRWEPPLAPFTLDPQTLATDVAATGEECWLRWAAPGLTGGTEVVDGTNSLLGMRTLRRLIHTAA